MTTGYYPSTGLADSKSVERNRGLFVTLPTGEIVNVDENDVTVNDLIIMIGSGGAEWLSPGSSDPLRAVPHALVLNLGNDKQATRNWYGKMFLPPPDAMLHGRPGISFKQHRDEMINESKLSSIDSIFNSELEKFSTGGKSHPSVFRALSTTPMSCTTSLGSPGVMCWAQCQAISLAGKVINIA